MHACPTCTAPWLGEPSCQRCGTELTLLLAVVAAATERAAEALVALAAGDLDGAATAARCAAALDRGCAARSMALVALARGDYQQTLEWWRVSHE